MSDLKVVISDSTLLKDAKLAFFQLTFQMIGLSLLVDAINVFFLSGLGIDPKLSVLFKLILISLALFQIGAYAPKVLAFVLIFFIFMLIGAIISFFETISLAGFVDDLTSGLKIYTAMIIFIYVALACHKWPPLVQKYGKWCLIFAFIVLSANMVLGLLGFGFSSYGNVDSESSSAIGIILSGRDEFIVSALDAFMRYANLADILFGLSKAGLGLINKNAMEIDPIDMYLWHGVFGILLFLTYLAMFFRVYYLSAVNKDSEWGSAVLLINIVLFAVSIIAGHILTSGMLAPFLGLINGLAYADLCLNKKIIKS